MKFERIDEKPPEEQSKLEVGEARRALIEKYQKERVALSAEIGSRISKYTSKVASEAGDWGPQGNFKMAVEGVVGTTLGGKKLTPKERVLYEIIPAISFLSYRLYYLAYKDQNPIALGGAITTTITTNVLFLLLKGSKALDSINKFLSDNPEIIPLVQKDFAAMAQSNIK